MATERVTAQQHDVDRQHDGANADAEGSLARQGVGEPECLPHVAGEDQYEPQRNVHEIAMNVLHDERERILSEITFPRLAHGARRWIGPERFVVSAAIVIARQAKTAGRPKYQQRRRERQPPWPPAGFRPEQAMR